MMSLREQLRRMWSESDTDMILSVVSEWLQKKIDSFGDVVIHSMHDNVKGKIAAQAEKSAYEKLLEEISFNSTKVKELI